MDLDHPLPKPYHRPPTPRKIILIPNIFNKTIFTHCQCLDYLSNQMHTVLAWNTPIFGKIGVFHICLVVDGMIWFKFTIYPSPLWTWPISVDWRDAWHCFFSFNQSNDLHGCACFVWYIRACTTTAFLLLSYLVKSIKF